MVIHDHEKEAQWAEQRRRQSREKSKSAEKKVRPLSVIAVQSLACTVILLLALLFRVAGGTAYKQLQQGFADSLAGNELMAMLMRWWDGAPSETASLPEEEGVKENSFTPSSALMRQGWMGNA